MRFATMFLALAFTSCATAPVIMPPPAPQAPTSYRADWLAPSPSWPIRVSQAGPTVPSKAESVPLLRPEVPVRAPVALILPQPMYDPPVLMPLPLQTSPVAPRAAKTTPITSDLKPAIVPAPKPVVAATKAPAAVPAAAVPLAPVVAKVPAPSPLPPPTDPFQNLSLLPGATPTNGDFAWQDMNLTAGETLALSFPKANWIYLDSPAQQKTLGYQSTVRDKDNTTMSFKPTIPGQFILEFQRQDLVAQTTEVRHIRLKVAAAGTRTASTGTVVNPQTTTSLNPDVLETSRKLAAAGRTSEAVQKLLQNYQEQDTRTNLEIARLLEQSDQGDEALGYLDKNLGLGTSSDFRDSLVLGTQIAAAKNPQTKLPAYVKQWLSGSVAPPESVYLQVLTALKAQKLLSLAKDWMKVYDLWYRSPQSKDQYLFLVGGLLEEPGELLNIKESYKSYQQIVENFPLSPWWKPAGDRAAYLNRHFLQVR